MNTEAIEAAAARLLGATGSGLPGSPVRDLLGSSDIDAAYAVQQIVVANRMASGARVIGRKIGLTNPRVQAQIGVDQPDFGVLLDEMVIANGGEVPAGRLLQPKMEAEVAFVLGADLDGSEEIGTSALLEAVAYAVPALEIVDSRVAGWDVSIVDTVADNASCGLFVLGEDRLTIDSFAPVDVDMQLWCDDSLVSKGTGKDCLGDPLLALAWLAETVRRRNSPLRAGEIVLSGALGPMVEVVPGASYRAEVSPLGPVSVSFAPEVRR